MKVTTDFTHDNQLDQYSMWLLKVPNLLKAQDKGVKREFDANLSSRL